MLFAGRAASKAAVMAAISSGLLAGSAQAEDAVTEQTPRGQAEVTFTSIGTGAGTGTLITAAEAKGATVFGVDAVNDGSLNAMLDSSLLPDAGEGEAGLADSPKSTASHKTVAGLGAGVGAFSLFRRADLLPGLFSGVNIRGGSGGGSSSSVAGRDPNGSANAARNGGLLRDPFQTRHPGDTVVGTLGFNPSAGNSGAGLLANGGPDSFGAQSLAGAPDATMTATAVPEPGEWMVIGMATAGLGGLMIRARRRRGAVAA